MFRHARRIAAAALVAAAVPLAAAPALAQDAATYGDESEYDAAVTGELYSYDLFGGFGSPIGGDFFAAEFTLGSPEASDPTQVTWELFSVTDAGSTSSPNGVGPLSCVFTDPVSAFKMELSGGNLAPDVDLYDADGNLIASVTAPNASGICGVIASVPVASFVIVPAPDGSGNPDRVHLVRIAASTAPEGGTGAGGTDTGGETGTGDAAGPADLWAALVATVEDADASAFARGCKQDSLLRKLEGIGRRIDAGDLRGLCYAAKRLERDVLPKVDGEPSPTDWVVDADLQQSLEDQVRALIASLQSAADALGGCPACDGHDGGDGTGHDGHDGRHGHDAHHGHDDHRHGHDSHGHGDSGSRGRHR